LYLERIMNACLDPVVCNDARHDSAALATPASAIARGAAALRHAWQQWCMDPRTLYLSQATDLADLERRLRAWERS
jgi:hypothetical protein